MAWGPFVVACMVGAGLGWVARHLPQLSLAQPARRPSEVVLSISRLTIAAGLGAAVAHAPAWPEQATFVAAMLGAVVFVVVAGNLPDADLAGSVARRIRRDLDGLHATDGRPVRISVGVAVAPQDGDQLDALLRLADRRMYEDNPDHEDD